MSIEESDIVGWLGATYAGRGEHYQRQGRVSDLRRRDEGLRARCQGSQRDPYKVRIRLDDGEYAGSSCSCPIGGGCKHVAAVLYEYVRREEPLPESAAIEERLSSLGRERLVAMMADYADGHPDFESWLEGRLAAEGLGGEPVDAEAIRRRAERIISVGAEAGYGYYGWIDELRDLIAPAKSHREGGAFEDAYNLLNPVFWALIERYEWFDDSHGEVVVFLGETATQIVELFEAAEAPEFRSELLREIWEIWLWDIGYNDMLEAPFWDVFLEFASEAERQTVADWTRAELDELVEKEQSRRSARYGGYGSSWRARSLGYLLVELEGDALSEVELEELVGRAHLEDWWARELLEGGEPERAAGVARTLESYRRLNLIDDFIDHERDDLAEALLVELWEDESANKSRVRDRFIEFRTERDQWDEALELVLDRFRSRPNRSDLRTVEQLARQAGRWEELEADLLNALGEASPSELIWYYLEDDDPDAAVAIWQNTDRDAYFDTSYFAEAIAETHPAIAVELLEAKAKRTVEARGRGNYQAACRTLSLVREIYLEHARGSDWQRTRRRFQEGYDNLPAFQDEFQKAGLAEEER